MLVFYPFSYQGLAITLIKCIKHFVFCDGTSSYYTPIFLTLKTEYFWIHKLRSLFSFSGSGLESLLFVLLQLIICASNWLRGSEKMNPKTMFFYIYPTGVVISYCLCHKVVPLWWVECLRPVRVLYF
jgi:hypothetical protein